jgi:Sec-independent protein translocase protein TatA
MNTMCGIGIPELVLLVLLIFVVVGPERSRGAALEIGRFLGKLLRSEWWKEISEITQSLRDLPTTLIKMAELEDMQSELRETLSDIQKSTKPDQADRQILAEMDGTIEDLYGQVHGITQPPTDQGEAPADQDSSEERI